MAVDAPGIPGGTAEVAVTTTDRHRPRSLVGLVGVLLVALLAVGLPVAATTPAAAAGAGTGVGGAVLGPGATGRSGIVVSAYDSSASADAAPAGQATSGAGGAYAIDLAPGRYRLAAVPPVDDPDMLVSAEDFVTVVDAKRAPLDFRLEVGNVRGVVRFADSTPAAGARVEAFSADGYDELTDGRTYADGSYRLAVPAGEQQVVASPPVGDPMGHVTTRQPVTVPASGPVTADVTLRLPNVRGSVFAPGGTTGVGGVMVVLTGEFDRPVPGGTTTAANDGTFGFAVEPGNYRIQAFPPSDNPNSWVDNTVSFAVSAGDTAAAPRHQNVELRQPTLRGRVLTPSGAPAPNAFVHLFHPASGQLLFGSADQNGNYGLVTPEGPVSIYLYPAVQTVEYLNTTVDFTVGPAPFVRDLTFDAPNVTGTVRSPDGAPAADLTVQAFAGPGTGASNDLTYSVTDELGRYAMRLSPGT